jgi:hypothetical protein
LPWGFAAEWQRLTEAIGTVRGKQEQAWWLIALAVFVFVMTLLGAPVWLAELPFGWNTGAAAIVMRNDRWDAGLGLIQAVDPAGEQDAAFGLNLVRANHDALTACYDAAVKAGKDQPCTITVTAP